jgi:SAM-dependent methyltransferase
MTDVNTLYGELWANDADIAAALAESLAPRPAEMLYDAFAALAPEAGDLVLDAGGRDARYAVELTRRFDCRVLVIDPIARHVRDGRRRVAAEDLSGRVFVVQGALEAIPTANGSIDHIWCRDVLNHVVLPAALAECARVLRPGGGMLVYQTFATAELAPFEADRLFRALAIQPPNMDPVYFERIARGAGFAIEDCDPIRSEWREHWAEAGDHGLLDDLLAVARLGRREDEFVARFGRPAVEAARGDKLWGIYQMLGKLCPTLYRLRRVVS